jgi:hypothetical protein
MNSDSPVDTHRRSSGSCCWRSAASNGAWSPGGSRVLGTMLYLFFYECNDDKHVQERQFSEVNNIENTI